MQATILFSLALLALTACAQATPVPTPTSTPTATPTPTLTPTPTPTAIPTPTLAPTPTAIPTATPIPTPTPISARAERALVRLAVSPDTVWTGVVISESGEILTTSEALVEAPVVDIRLGDGRQGWACVTGRDDDVGLALLEPLIELSGAYDYLELSSESPAIGQQLELFQHSSSQSGVASAVTRVAGSKSSDNGYGYILVNADSDTIADGAVLLDESGRMEGMRMPSLWLQLNQIANHDDVVAVDAPAIASIALPILRSGRMHVQPVSLGYVDDFSPVPIIFHGEITVDGAPAPPGTLVHAKVSKEGQSDRWQSTRTGMVGEYVFPVSDTRRYKGGTVEFWVDCERSPMTVAYDIPSGAINVVEQALAF